jgi:hypothetical protein
MAEGMSDGPMRHLCSAATPCLFDLSVDPFELDNLLGPKHARREAFAGLDEQGRPAATRHAATLRAVRQRLEALSAEGPPPVSSSGDGDAFPEAACQRVRDTGSWLPWE